MLKLEDFSKKYNHLPIPNLRALFPAFYSTGTILLVALSYLLVGYLGIGVHLT